MQESWSGMRVVLASASPRRKALLEQMGISPEIIPSRIDERTKETEPERVVMELSGQKAREVSAACGPGTIVIGADTVVAADAEVLGKPGTPERAYEMLAGLQGRVHQVYTGVTLLLRGGDGRLHSRTFFEKTDVSVYPMTEQELWEYARSGEPLDKAGAYGIQGHFAVFIEKINGDYDNVVGLPLGRLYHELKNLTEEIEEDD